MRRAEKERFARPFAEIWQHLPFHPGARVAEFVERFVVAGRFDAERFWEFVTAREPQSRKKPVARETAQTTALVGNAG